MKYFRHYCNAHENPNLGVLIDDWGVEGYGRYWILVELVGEQVSKSNLSYAYQTSNGNPVLLGIIARLLRMHAQRLCKFCDYLATHRLIDKKAWEEKKLIYIPKLQELNKRVE